MASPGCAQETVPREPPVGGRGTCETSLVTAESVPTSARAVFIVGPPRSGTTLLTHLLAGGADVLSLSEPFRLHQVFPRLGLWWTFRKLNRAFSLSLAPPRRCMGDDMLLDHLRRTAALNGLSTLVIKETFRSHREWANVEQVDRFAATGDPLVALIRHPVDCAVSTLRMFRLWRGVVGPMVRVVVPDVPLFHGDSDIVRYVADSWNHFLQWCESHRPVVLRYEDLVTRPHETLAGLCANCGLAFDARMLDPQHPRGPFGGIGDPGVMTRPPRPISNRSVGRRRQLPQRLHRIITEGCSQTARHWGYDL